MKTLENTIFSSIYNLTWSKDDNDLFDKVSIGMIVSIVGVVVLNFIRPFAYGKLASTKQENFFWCFPLSSKFVWRVSSMALGC